MHLRKFERAGRENLQSTAGGRGREEKHALRSTAGGGGRGREEKHLKSLLAVAGEEEKRNTSSFERKIKSLPRERRNSSCLECWERKRQDGNGRGRESRETFEREKALRERNVSGRGRDLLEQTRRRVRGLVRRDGNGRELLNFGHGNRKSLVNIYFGHGNLTMLENIGFGHGL